MAGAEDDAGVDEDEAGLEEDAATKLEVAKLEEDPIVTVPLLTRVVVTVTMLVEVDGAVEALPVTPPVSTPELCVEDGTAGMEVETDVRVSGQTVVD